MAGWADGIDPLEKAPLWAKIVFRIPLLGILIAVLIGMFGMMWISLKGKT